MSPYPQCTIQNRNVHISVLNGALWDMGQRKCGICEIIQQYPKLSANLESLDFSCRQTHVRLLSKENGTFEDRGQGMHLEIKTTKVHVAGVFVITWTITFNEHRSNSLNKTRILQMIELFPFFLSFSDNYFVELAFECSGVLKHFILLPAKVFSLVWEILSGSINVVKVSIP